MQKKFFILCLTSILFFTGCNSNSDNITNAGEKPKEEQEAKPSLSEKNLEKREIKSKDTKNFEAQVEEFNLGKGEYVTNYGKTMPYDIRGVMAVPKGDAAFPLVVMIHGSHSNIDETKRFDTGFTYLAKSLAENGYIAVSLDVSKAFIWKYGDSDDKEKVMYLTDEHLKYLKEANEGMNDKFPINLKGKIDFSKIMLIGHSRSASTIFDIALQQKEKGINVSALLSIAPTMPTEIENQKWPFCNASIIVPEYDGDIASLDGFMIDTVLSEKLDNLHAVTYLYGANHNYFNTNLKQNDALLNRTEDELKDQLSDKTQQRFLVDYTLDYLNATFMDNKEDTMYSFKTLQPDSMYGCSVLTRLTGSKKIKLVDISDTSQFEPNKIEAKPVLDSWFYKNDQVIVDTITFGRGEYETKPLLYMKWNQPENQITFNPTVEDISNGQALTIRMIPDSSDESYKDLKAPGFSLKLEDKDKNIQKIIIPPESNVLRITPGKMDSTKIEDIEHKFWSSATPIGDIRIPLSYFDKVDLKHVKKISICFDKEKNGAMYLESILLQK